jgi:hypothetical protein
LQDLASGKSSEAEVPNTRVFSRDGVGGRPRAELPTARLNPLNKTNAATAVLERSDTMNWVGEYVIDDSGICRWYESLRIHDEPMKSAYRKNVLIEFIIETSAVMGVKVGIA